MKKILLFWIIATFGILTFAQSSPGFTTGQIPTAAQWNGYFAQKQDYVVHSVGSEPTGFTIKLSANLNSTSDQAITGLPTKYMLTGVYVTNASGAVTTAVGGIYTSISKGGSQIVYSGQSYSALAGPAVLLTTSFAVGALETAYTATTIYLSLTTAQGSAMSADFYVIGVALP
jgi:hypothetical protein